jgi:hypothetical protein
MTDVSSNATQPLTKLSTLISFLGRRVLKKLLVQPKKKLSLDLVASVAILMQESVSLDAQTATSVSHLVTQKSGYLIALSVDANQ